MAAAHGGALAIAPYPVLDPGRHNPLVRLANLPAFWLIFLVVEFPAFYLAGIVSLVVLLKERAPPERGNVTQAFAVLLIASLGAAWLLASTLGFSNDLGWRAVLPAVLLLIVFAAAGLARLAQKPASAAFAAALALVLLALPDGVRMIYANVVAAPNPARQGLRHHAGALAGGAAARGAQRARRQQSVFPGGTDAVAGQHFLGAAGEPALVLCRQHLRAAVQRAVGAARRAHRSAIRARLSRARRRRRRPADGGAISLHAGRAHAGGRRLEPRSVRGQPVLPPGGSRPAAGASTTGARTCADPPVE